MDEANEGAPVFAKVKLSLTKNKCFFENGSIAMHRWWTGAGQHVLGPAGDRAKGEGDRQEVLFWPGMLSYGMICDGMVWYGMTRYDMIWYALLWYDMAWPGMIWSGMTRYDMTRYALLWYARHKNYFPQTLHGPGIRVRYSQHLNCIDTDLVNWFLWFP